jgi:hypothetical protein
MGAPVLVERIALMLALGHAEPMGGSGTSAVRAMAG